MKLPDIIQPGDIIDGKYRVEKVLGRGGMGVVVEALHLRLGTSVAIKVLSTAKRTGRTRGGDVEALVREAQVSARLRSEHVARVFDVGMLEDGTPFVVMEHLAGCTLHEAMYSGAATIPAERAIELVLEACDAVAEAHGLGIIHRDLKPANLFLTRLPNGRDVVKVLDFGIAKLATDAKIDAAEAAPPADRPVDAFCTGELVPGTVLAGTPQYMAPEHFDRVPRITTAGDVWSLGVILYELLAGRRPYECKQLLELIWRVTSTAPTMLREIRPDLDPALERVVMTCLARQPEDRYRRVEDLAAALRPFAGLLAQRVPTRSVSIAPGTPPSPHPSLSPTVETATIAIGSPRAPRRGAWGGPAVIALAVIAGISSAAWLQRTAVRRATPAVQAAAPPAASVVAPAPAVVVMGGSSTVAELGQHWVSALAASRQDVVLQVQSTSTAAGLGALVRHELDLVGASRPATEEELALARAGGVELVAHVVARDGLAVVVHPDNPVDVLSMEQLRGVLTGRIRSWSSMGGGKGSSRPIHVLARPEDQGSSEILRNLVLKHGDHLADSAEIVRRSEDAISRVKNDPNAVTFVTFRDVGGAKTLKLRIGSGAPVAPSTGTIRSEHYPLRRDLFVYTRHDARREAADVLGFIEGPGRRVVSESGFVPPLDTP